MGFIKNADLDPNQKPVKTCKYNLKHITGQADLCKVNDVGSEFY